MILVSVAKGPNGENPGIFLTDGTSLHHVSSMPDVNAYKSAGVAGPVVISYADYLNYTAEAKARVAVVNQTVTAAVDPAVVSTAVQSGLTAMANKIATLPA